MKKAILLILILFILGIADDAFGQGCSQCKLLAEQGSDLDEASFGSNINMGILYLMAAPYILMLLFFRKRIFSFFRSLKKG